MKVLLSTEGEALESKISKRFGEAPYYLIYNTETNETETRINEGHDEDHAGLIELVNEGVLHYIIGNSGPFAFKILDERDAELYLARNLIAKDALDLFLNKELKRLTAPTFKKPLHNK